VADLELFAPGLRAAPLTYQVPGGQEIGLKVLAATFDGTGAGSAWQPAIQIVGPSGQVLRTFALEPSLAAGVSADVTFFPGVKPPAAAAAASAGLWAQMSATNQGPASNVAFAYDFGNNLDTNDPVTFTRDVYPAGSTPRLAGKHGLGIHKAGIYQIDVAAYVSPVIAPANPIYTYGVLFQQDAGDGTTVQFKGGPNQMLSSGGGGFVDPLQSNSFEVNFRQLMLVSDTGSGAAALPYTVEVFQLTGQTCIGGVSIVAQYVSAS